MYFRYMTVHSVTSRKLYTTITTVVCTRAGEVNILYVLSHVTHVVSNFPADVTWDCTSINPSGYILVKFIQLAWKKQSLNSRNILIYSQRFRVTMETRNMTVHAVLGWIWRVTIFTNVLLTPREMFIFHMFS